MRTSGITTFVQGGCQSSLHISTNGHTWKCACNFCSSIMKKERVFCNRLSQVMKLGCTTMNLEANIIAWHGVEIHITTQDHGIQKCAFCQQSDVDTILGLWDFSGPSLSTFRVMDRWSILHSKYRGMLRNAVVLHYDNV